MLNRRSIFLNIFLNYFFIVFFILCTTIILFFNILRNELTTSIYTRLLHVAKSIQIFLPDKYFQHKNDIIKLANSLETRITFFDTTGKILFDTIHDTENNNNKPEIISALSGEIGFSERYSSILKKSMIYVAIPVIKNKKPVLIIRVNSFTDVKFRMMEHFKKTFVHIFFVFIILAIFFAAFSAQKYSHSIKELRDAVFKFGIGQLKTKAIVKKSYIEIDDLAFNFNIMAEKIESLINNLEIEKQKINNIVESIYVGILAIDRYDNVILTNKTFNNFINFNEGMSKTGNIKKNYREYIREHLLIDAINECKRNKKNLIKEIFLQDKFFLCSLTYISKNESLILVLNDISTLKQLDQLKKNFVANISHELRTPLTSIKGFLDTMQENKEYNDDYVKIMQHNTNRIIKIVNDLIFLSKLETLGKESLHLEKINKYEIKNILQDILNVFEKELKNKNLEVFINIELEDIFFDKTMFYTLILNLVSNAIRYSDKGQISIKFWQNCIYKYLSIEDTGIGIDKKYISRIFERFFVIDVGRSRKTGGTGLGLSIVKHIVLLHSYNIKVDSNNLGTKFIVEMKNY